MVTDKKHILIIAVMFLTALGLWSCAIDPAGNGGNENDPRVGYFSFRFDAGKVPEKTRAEEAGADRENHVDQVYLLLYNKTGNLKYAWDLTVTNFDGSGLKNFSGTDVVTDDNPTPGRFTSIAREVSYEPYQLVVIANPGKFSDTVIFGKNPANNNLSLVIGLLPELSGSIYRSLTALQGTVDGVGLDDFGYAYFDGDDNGEKAFMSNANGPVLIPLPYIRDTREAAEEAPVPVFLDRALAKVLINKGSNVKVTDGTGSANIGEVKEFKWILMQWNTQTYLLRRFGRIGDHCPDPTYAGQTETYENGLHVGREYLYATDPNMGAGNFFASETRLPADPSLDTARDWNTGSDESNRMYSTENTMNPEAQGSGSFQYGGYYWHEYTTHVWVRAKLRINAFQAVDNFWSLNTGTTAAPSWVMCTWKQAKEWWDNDSFPQDMDRLKSILTYAQTSGLSVAKVFDMSAATEPVFESGDADYNTSLYGPVSLTDPSLPDFPLAYHRDGICNYRIPVTHFNTNGEGTGDYGYYGAVRNNVYKITVNGIVGPGVIPDTGVSGYISFDISVNPWNVRNEQGEDGRPPIHQEE